MTYPTEIEGNYSKTAYVVLTYRSEDKYIDVAKKLAKKYNGLITGAVAVRMYGVPYVAIHDVDIIAPVTDFIYDRVDGININVVPEDKLPDTKLLLIDPERAYVKKYPGDSREIDGVRVVTPEYLVAYWIMRIIWSMYGKDTNEKDRTKYYIPLRLRVPRAVAEYFVIKSHVSVNDLRVVELLRYFNAYDIYTEKAEEIANSKEVDYASAELAHVFGWNFYDTRDTVREAILAYL